jgi:mRNA-degrading endonuclease RelE of RelBE toxin-antitoxin system
MSWVIAVSNRARKNLKRVPVADRQRIMTELDAMHVNPLSGDVVKLAGQHAFRRRVGSYRIIFRVDFKSLAVAIMGIERRTTTTYR